jgi:hypothetical protein
MKVLKYQLNKNENHQEIKMPSGAEILCVKIKGHDLQLYILANTEQVFEQTRHFQIVETGKFISNVYRKYVGTVCMGAYSLHVFELINKPMITNEQQTISENK